MIGYILRRLVALGLTLLAAALVIFVVLEILPGDPAAVTLGLNAAPEALAALRTEMGLDKPAVLRFFIWLGGLVTGDLGLILATIDALDTSAPRKAALRRHVWRPHRFHALLQRYGVGHVAATAARAEMLAAEAAGMAVVV